MQSRDASHSPVTVIGLGLMGQALAEAFLHEGHPTTVWNRTSTKAEQLVTKGAKRAETVAAAVSASPLVVICVSDYDAVHEVLDPLDGALDGRVLVNLTSGTSAQARQTAEWVGRRGAAYLDGAILAAPAGIGTPDAVVLYSGPRDSFDLHNSTLTRLGAGTTFLGDDHGLSSLYDVAVLGLMWGILNGFLHGAALLGAAGVNPTTFTPIASAAIGTITDWLPSYAQQISDGAYPGDDSTIDTHLAAMQHLVHESESIGVDASLPRFIKAVAHQAVAEGQGGNSYAAIVEQFRKVRSERP